jgi:hypothetical protein
MPSFFMRFTVLGTLLPYLIEGLRDTMGEIRVYSEETVGLSLYFDPNETEIVTMQNLRWTDDGKRSAAVCDRDFTIERHGKAIPGVAWQPLRVTGARPLVLMGHGGTGHKRSDKLNRMAEIFTAGYGWWAGMRGSSVQRSGIDQHFKVYAARVRVPLLFNIQWDDERFDRDGQIELYETLGSTNKRLHAYPGRHSDDGPEALESSAAFLQRYLQ